MNIKEAFNRTTTENGDFAFYSYVKNPHVDFLFRLTSIREHFKTDRLKAEERLLHEFPSLFLKNEFNMFFAMYIRDPRFGLGEREIGRCLLRHQKIDIDWLITIGRADDLLYCVDKRELVGFIKKCVYGETTTTDLVRKWLPREKTREFKIIRNELLRQKVSMKSYRKFISLPDTVESIRSRGEFPKNYEHVPSLSMIKHKSQFMRDDNFRDYLGSIQRGEKKINVSVTTPFDLMRSFMGSDSSMEKSEKEAFYSTAFRSLPKIELGRSIAIIDNSASMYDTHNSYLKARSIGHFIARNSEYMKNHFIVFSRESRILKLTDDDNFSYIKDFEILSSFHDMTCTNFERVMQNLSDVTEDLPEYIVVLSDMQFDASDRQFNTPGNNNQKMIKEMNEKGVHMIWWNFNCRNTTFPTIDKNGNIFISGYSPQILSVLSKDFDAESFVMEAVNAYRKKIEPLLKK